MNTQDKILLSRLCCLSITPLLFVDVGGDKAHTHSCHKLHCQLQALHTTAIVAPAKCNAGHPTRTGAFLIAPSPQPGTYEESTGKNHSFIAVELHGACGSLVGNES